MSVFSSPYEEINDTIDDTTSWPKTAGIDVIWRNYVTVTLRIKHFSRCSVMSRVTDKDACRRSRTKQRFQRIGYIDWPITVVGSRAIVRCPYAYDQPLYAHRDCTLSSSEQLPNWTGTNVAQCPDSPFRQGVDRLVSFLVSKFILPS